MVKRNCVRWIKWGDVPKWALIQGINDVYDPVWPERATHRDSRRSMVSALKLRKINPKDLCEIVGEM